MNPLERWIEGVVGYPVDWNATGTWVTAFITAFAVFLAAVLTELVNRRTERRHDGDRLEVLSVVYRSIGEVLEAVDDVRRTGVGFTAGMLRTIDDLIEVLDKVPILELPGRAAAEDLVVVRRILGHVRDEVTLWADHPPYPESEAYARARRRVAKAERRVVEFAATLRRPFWASVLFHRR